MLEKLPEVVGHLLRDRRAGLDHIVFNRIDLRNGMAAIDLRSLAFADHAPLPERCTADGPGTSPPLSWTGVPAAADSLVLVVEDADAPTPQPLVHAIAVGLAAEDGALAEGALDGSAPAAAAGSGGDEAAVQVGRHSLLGSGWLPPDPPPGHGVHRYAFQLFALAPGASFSSTPGRDEVVDLLVQHALASGLLIGTYARPDGSQTAGADAVVTTPAMPG